MKKSTRYFIIFMILLSAPALLACSGPRDTMTEQQIQQILERRSDELETAVASAFGEITAIDGNRVTVIGAQTTEWGAAWTPDMPEIYLFVTDDTQFEIIHVEWWVEGNPHTFTPLEASFSDFAIGDGFDVEGYDLPEGFIVTRAFRMTFERTRPPE